MSTPKLYKTEAIVLKGSDLGEADRLLTLITPRLGKLKAVARGARKPKSKLGGHVETLTHSLMMVAEGHTLDVVSQSQTLHSFIGLRQDLEQLSLGLYAADLVNCFTEEHQENQAIFHLLVETLDWLSDVAGEKAWPAGETVLRHFELHLLEHLGYQPQLHQCIHCQQELAPVVNFFSPSAGGTVCPHCREQAAWVKPVSVNALKCLRLFQSDSRQACCRVKVGPELSLELKNHLQGYLRYLLEKDIKSATWLDRLQHSEYPLLSTR
ncbi:MAG: DNA repair protein RecO [Chloroflexi bacterium]|nr:DNA repair protein RecO [Chloroflexota bacterium]